MFNDFPADKAKGLMQLAGKGNPVVENVSAPATVTDSGKVQTAVPAQESSLPVAPADAHKPAARPNTSGNYCALSIWLFNVHLAESYYAD